MGVYSKNIDRDKMAVELYFSVLKLRKAEGMTHKEAKNLAYDAVELRYNISPKRLQNIIYDNHETLKCNREVFVAENIELIETLKGVNAVSENNEFVEQNEKLIKILEEVSNV
jgi:hypothetical protein